jgi:NTE family protein
MIQKRKKRTMRKEPMITATKKTALVLGSGGARGWAHIGVLKALRELGCSPDMVVGTSIGAIVGAFHAVGAVEEADRFASSIDWKQVAKLFFEVNIPRSGLLKGHSIMRLLRSIIPVKRIEQLPVQYAAVATDLRSEKEVVMTEGDIFKALRASFSIPGVFTPVEYTKGQWLVDGGLVNPLPISVARELGATHVVAVDINLAGCSNAPVKAPALMDVLLCTFRIIENSMTRECLLQGEPPDLLIQPAVGCLGTLEFHNAAPAIKRGYDAVMEQKKILLSLFA